VAVRIPRLQHGRSAIVAARAIVPSTSNIAAASGSWRARVQRIDDCTDMFPFLVWVRIPTTPKKMSNRHPRVAIHCASGVSLVL